jgi:hypothetical protein
MIYHQYADGHYLMDVDQISDKHKISLFDESKFEDFTSISQPGKSTLGGAPGDEY